MGRLDGRIALVTGAGRGFGRAIALAFGREGADLVVNYNASGPAAKEVVAELERLGRRAEAVQADVARADQVRAMVDRAVARFGRLDILVNNAGVMTRGQFLDVPIADYETMFDINVEGRSSAPSTRCVRWWPRATGASSISPRSSSAPRSVPAASQPTRRPRAPSRRSLAQWPTSSGLTASPSTPSRPAELTPT